MRLWVEIVESNNYEGKLVRQPLYEAVSWNNHNRIPSPVLHPSASLWGCELKCLLGQCRDYARPVSLFMRLWVEMIKSCICEMCDASQPLYEAVSWNIAGYRTYCDDWSQPLYEAVSWNVVTCTITMQAQFVSLFMRLWVEIRHYLDNG